MTRITCDKCNGTGTIDIPDEECDATIDIGHERFRCWAPRPHAPHVPHLAILVMPCYACGGFEDHHESCGVYDMVPWPESHDAWFQWFDHDLTVERIEIPPYNFKPWWGVPIIGPGEPLQ